jgi:hypothetical protein
VFRLAQSDICHPELMTDSTGSEGILQA